MAQPDLVPRGHEEVRPALPPLCTGRKTSGCKILTVELARMICNEPTLSNRDLKHLRLTSRLWGDAASKPLFESITLHPFETFLDINALVRIAGHVSTLNVLGIEAIESLVPDLGVLSGVSPYHKRHSRDDPRLAPYPLPPFLGPQKLFPQLKSLKLSDIDAGSQQLLEFLLAHAGKLEDVEFRNVYINVTPWKAIIMGMATHMTLKNVKFEGKLVQRHRSQIKGMDYVWYIKMLPCCQSGEFHDDCLKGRIENYVVNVGYWVPKLPKLMYTRPTTAKLGEDKQDYDESWTPTPPYSMLRDRMMSLLARNVSGNTQRLSLNMNNRHG